LKKGDVDHNGWYIHIQGMGWRVCFAKRKFGRGNLLHLFGEEVKIYEAVVHIDSII